MKKIIKPILVMSLVLCLIACKKKENTSRASTTKINSTKIIPTKTEKTNKTTTAYSTTAQKQQYYIKLDFGDFGEYNVSDEYKGWHYVDEISKDCFPFDLVWKLHNFKGWSYEGEHIFDENGNKIKDFDVTSEMIFNVIFEPIDELKVFDYSLGMTDDQFNILGFANNDPNYLLTITDVEIPNKVTWNGEEFEIYRIHANGDKLNGCNNIENLTIPYASGISARGFF